MSETALASRRPPRRPPLAYGLRRHGPPAPASGCGSFPARWSVRATARKRRPSGFGPYSWDQVMESPQPNEPRPTDTGHVRQDTNMAGGAVGTHTHLPRPHSMNSPFSAREVERRTTWASVAGRMSGVYTFGPRTAVLPPHGRRSPDAPSPAPSVRQTLTSRRCTKNMGPTLEHCDFTPYGRSRRYGVFLFTARGVPQRIARRRAPCGSLPPVPPGGSAADLSCATHPCRPADRLHAPVARCSRQPDLSHNHMQGRPR